MPEILSQSEIDSLLSGLSTGAPSQEQGPLDRRTEKDVLTFDFRLPHRLSKNQLRIFQAVHENFGEALGTYLVSRLQTQVQVDVTSVDQLFYSEYVLSIASPSCLYVLRVLESDALAILEISPQLVLALVERLLGGSDETVKPARLITRIEQSIVKGIVNRAILDLQRAWKTIAELTFKLERYESEGDFAQIAPTSEIVLVVSFQVIIGEQKYLMNLCFPTFALDSVLAKLNTQNLSAVPGGKAANEWGDEIFRKVVTTQVEATAVLGETQITLRDLLQLEVGDVIRTGVQTSSEVKILVGDKPRMWGRPGVVDGKVAIKVTRFANGTS